jgi:tetratricopeptide (TPR) repeat protein
MTVLNGQPLDAQDRDEGSDVMPDCIRWLLTRSEIPNERRWRCWHHTGSAPRAIPHTSRTRKRGAWLPRPSLVHRASIAALFVCLAVCLCARSAAAASIDELQTMFRTGQYAECATAAAAEVESNQFSETIRVVLLRSQLELGRYADSLKTLDAALEKIPQSILIRWWGRDACRYTGQAARVGQLEQEIAQQVQQFPWRYTDPANHIVVGRMLLSQGVDPKKVLTGIYNPIKKREPGAIDVYLASGDLALEKNDFQLAGEAYQQAAKVQPESPEAQLGVARAFAPSDDEKMEAAITAALSANPKHIETLLFVADHQIDSERYTEAVATLDEIAAVNPQHPLMLAYRAVLSHLKNELDLEQQHRAAGLKHWAENPEVDYLIGKKLSQKYRFREGEQYQRAALKLNEKYLPAKVQLASDLLRLGREEEGLKVAEEVYEADGYNIFAHNLVTLQESLEKFRSLEDDGLIVRMDAREAEIYGSRVVDLLKRAREQLCAKYGVELPRPIIVEMFPRQEDFAIRTFGLPGGAGFLAVCFGTVITANSPASQGTTPACWEATLWHEFCHVVTLNKTHNKMPRWLSEGISVYEERQADPRWGQTMTPQYREMILGDDFVPVSKLSGAFLSPKSGMHLNFAYFESSLAVQYLVEQHGLDTMKKILDDLGVGMPINEVLGRHTGSIEELDAKFAKYAREQALSMAPLADWSEPELPMRADLETVSDWLKLHPSNYPALQRLAGLQISHKKWDEAKTTVERMLSLFPNDDGGASPLAMLARIHRERGEKAEEREALEQLASLTDDRVDLLTRLTELTIEAKDWEKTRTYALRWLAINPLTPEPHRRLATAAIELNDPGLAVQSRQALLKLDPFDLADAHYQLAVAFKAHGDPALAKRHVLLALDETPRYRAAQTLLLELTGTPVIPATSETGPDAPAPSTADVPPPPPLPRSASAPADKPSAESPKKGAGF